MFIELHSESHGDVLLLSCLQIIDVTLERHSLPNHNDVTFVTMSNGKKHFVTESYQTVATLIAQATRVVTG